MRRTDKTSYRDARTPLKTTGTGETQGPAESFRWENVNVGWAAALHVPKTTAAVCSASDLPSARAAASTASTATAAAAASAASASSASSAWRAPAPVERAAMAPKIETMPVVISRRFLHLRPSSVAAAVVAGAAGAAGAATEDEAAAAATDEAAVAVEAGRRFEWRCF